jgi:ABC-type multidrug transport system fused ATPase/permease subunit
MKHKHTLKRLAGYLKKYRFLLVLLMTAAVISTVFAVLAPAVTGEITTALFDGASSGTFDWQWIVTLLVVLVVLYLAGQLFAYLQGFGMAKVTSKVMQEIRNDIDRKMHRTTLNYYDSRTNGEILSVITNDVDTVSSTLSGSLTQIVTQVITAVGILLMMLRVNGWLTLIAVILVPVSLLASGGVMKASAEYFGQQQKNLGDLNGFIEEMYNGQSVVRSFGYTKRAEEQFDQLNRQMQKSAQNAETASGTISPITSLVNNLGYAFSAVLGCLFVLSGRMTVGSVQSMLQYTRQFSQPFTSIASMAGNFGAAMAAADRIFALLDAEEEIPDPKEGAVPALHEGTVSFEHVSFGYTPDHLLMHDVNIHVKPGQKVAIVGPTGAGKTTLVNLLMRFYETGSGRIVVDGVDTKDMTRKELRSRFGMVLQDTWLFEGTILENLAYAKDGLSKEQVIQASRAACADEFIRTLPGGYEMKLSHGGENVSQGERQLLTIARAMAADPEIMILDEATSNVDTDTEQKIQTAMKKLMSGRTSFVIAHRLATIRDADMILYMEHGDIKEAGTHESLMKLNGKYASLYNSQFA